MAGHRLTWAEIDLGAMAHNVRELRKRIGPEVRILGVVKDDGYGHGAVPVARTALEAGVGYLGVSGPDEGRELREAGLKAPILIFGAGRPEEAGEIVEHNLTATLCTDEFAASLARSGRERGQKAKVHLKVDTGMGRIGVHFEEAADFVRRWAGEKNLEIAGIYTHFPSAEEEDKTFSRIQIARFKEVIARLGEEGINIPLKHLANSAAILNLPESYFDLVRPGLIIYGLYPGPAMRKEINLRPALSLKTKIVYLKRTPPGISISYGRTYITGQETMIATLPVGYGDGYSRFLSNKGEVLVKGKRAPIRGRVCMDQTMIEVGHLPGVRVGDEVVLIGKQGKENISVEEIAEKIATVPHEIVCRLAKRVPRSYSQD